jgi:methyltransferase family protein
MNDLENYFAGNTGRQIMKWRHYFEIYDRHLARFRGTDVHVLEFGVAQGGSAQMWKHYFGPRCRVYGVDKNPACKQAEEERIEVFIGDQADRKFLRELAARIPRIDILIDDGGHRMKQQIRTFEELFPRIDANGVYLCEDLHTSYWSNYGGGYRRRGTFIEYAKNFIDDLHGWHARGGRPRISEFTRSVHGLHFYDSVLVIEKRPIEAPSHAQTGTASIPDFHAQPRLMKRIERGLKRGIRRLAGKGD